MTIFDIINEIKGLTPEAQHEQFKKLKTSLSKQELRQIADEAHTIDPPWFRNALLKAIELRTPILVDEAQPEVKGDVAYNIEEIRSEAVAESIGQIVHELSPIIGSLELSAARELQSYDNSRTKREIGRLQEMVEMFSAWRRAEQRPNYRKVNVYSLVYDEVQRGCDKAPDIEIVVNIDDDLSFDLDCSLTQTIISNALRNAIESTKQVLHRSPRGILVSSGLTDTHFWLSVIDDGIGLPESEEVLLKSRYTTKVGNTGLGLSIVNKSISSMNGTWNLKNSLPNGAEFYFEIPRGEN
ncbi:hypothetical protein UB33_05730 [Photobacterium angustum]|uniref:sensor histidine kinase n=1 Tax=Photobacterium angustum TaxID=661 RepID=UPI0005E0AC6E|nr:HAMP domain-containing sensor histidine kinase [Photobacterium angustum]KJF93404.1 hypothetical protein UB39_15995 [Photobacterium angustum]KJG07185.1 hypothetical protein UB33_05730 [Photobacterium angustum]PSV90402.1 sensor histidine kinase [Photobacterium angustum]PSW83189.1 sensor histidine kinase [Photobacterium angustum]